MVIVWVYYSSQIFFLGAEFTRAWSLQREQHEAANDKYGSEPLEMEEVARHIVEGGVMPSRRPLPGL